MDLYTICNSYINLTCWHTECWVHAYQLLPPNSTVQCWVCLHCSLSFVFLAERTGNLIWSSAVVAHTYWGLTWSAFYALLCCNTVRQCMHECTGVPKKELSECVLHIIILLNTKPVLNVFQSHLFLMCHICSICLYSYILEMIIFLCLEKNRNHSDPWTSPHSFLLFAFISWGNRIGSCYFTSSVCSAVQWHWISSSWKTCRGAS